LLCSKLFQVADIFKDKQGQLVAGAAIIRHELTSGLCQRPNKSCCKFSLCSEFFQVADISKEQKGRLVAGATNLLILC